MKRNTFQRANMEERTNVIGWSDFFAWGNAKAKRRVNKQLRRFARRKLNREFMRGE